MPTVKILAPEPEPKPEKTGLAGPVEYRMVTQRPLMVDEHRIPAGTEIGRFTVNFGLNPGSICDSVGRWVSIEFVDSANQDTPTSLPKFEEVPPLPNDKMGFE